MLQKGKQALRLMLNLWFLWWVTPQSLCCQWGLETKLSSKGKALGTLKQKCCRPVALVQSVIGGTRAMAAWSSQSPSLCSPDGAEPLLPADLIVYFVSGWTPSPAGPRHCSDRRWMGGTTQVGIATSGSAHWGLYNHLQVEKVGKGTSLLSQPRQQLLHILDN